MSAEQRPVSGVFTRFADLRAGEAVPVRGIAVALAGVIAGHTLLETARDALFLTRLPASRLAIVYILVAGATLLASRLNASVIRRSGRRGALVGTLLASAAGTTLFYFVPRTEGALFVLYTWSALLGTLLVAQLWMLADQIFTVQQSKRLFGLIGAGGIVGAMAGGGGAALVLAVIPIQALLLVSSGVFVATAAYIKSLDDGCRVEAEPARAAPAPPPESLLAAIRRYPYLRRMALVMALSTAPLLLGDYLFKSIAAAHVPAAGLGIFLARTSAASSALCLAVQLLLAGRIIRHLGVVPALLLLPLLLAMGSLGIFLTGGSLAMAVAAKGADGSLRYSLHRVGSEVLWMPLQADVRDRSRALLDSVGTKVVQAAAAGLVLLLAAFGAATPRVLAALTLALSAGWIVANLALKGAYLDLFRKALARGTLDVRGLAPELDPSSFEAVLEVLSSRDPARVIAAVDLLHDKKRDRMIPGLILYHESDAVLLRALRLASETGRRDWAPLASRLLEHAAEPVRTASVYALANLGERSALQKALSDQSPAVRAHAAFCLAAAGTTPKLADDESIAAIRRLGGEPGRAAAVALLGAIADREDARFAGLVLEMAKDPRPSVAAAAAAAMAKIEDERFIPLLISMLSRRSGRGRAEEALVRQGDAALSALAHALRDADTPVSVRVHVPSAISRFGTQRAADLLTTTLAANPMRFVRHKALRGLGRLAVGGMRLDRERVEAELRKNLVEHLHLVAIRLPLERDPDPRAGARAETSGSLVLDLLADKQRHSLERAFRLLGLLHPREDLRRAHRVLRSGDGGLRAHATEFLDALTQGDAGPSRETRELIRLVIDDLPAEERIARAEGFIPPPPADYEEALVALLRDHDDALATFGAYHTLDVGTPRLIAEVERACVERPYLNVATPLASRLRPSPVVAGEISPAPEVTDDA
jgi:ATP:ADP antiporter, AAA family